MYNGDARPWRGTRGLVFAVLVAVLSGVATAAPPSGVKLTDPYVADKVGISVQQLHALRDKYNLTN
jgi:hypothetical protein